MPVESFGKMPDGRRVERILLSTGTLSANILTYGAVLQDLRLKEHAPALVLGFDSFNHYLTHSPYFGAAAGRCANRIRAGHLPIDGKIYQLNQNYLGKHHLHGGAGGIGKSLWAIDAVGSDFVDLSIRLADGEMGYPGNMRIGLTYRLLRDDVLDITITAGTDKTTLCNIAHHSYFNLDGAASILDHLLCVNASSFLPVDDELIPTGSIGKVDGSIMDFRKPKSVGSTSQPSPIDHNFCLARRRAAMRPVAHLKAPRSGVAMEVRTTEPGIQVYDGAKINVEPPGLDGIRMGPHAGIALEPQVWPDAVHHGSFPQAVLRPGETYRQHTQYAFSKENR